MVGTVLSLQGAPLAELAAAPFDLVWIDLEHGALGLAEMQDLAIGAQAAETAAAVRIPRWDWDRLPAVLDAGVDGVVVPTVESADQAAAVCARLRHPPDGVRGFGPRRAGGYGRVPRFWASPQAYTACLIQIETPAGVEAATAIAQVPGVDALVVGCSDLSLALGSPQELDAPALRESAAVVRSAASSAGVSFGVAGAGEPAALAELAGPDAGLLVYSTDVRLYGQAVDAIAADVRAALAVVDREGARVGN